MNTSMDGYKLSKYGVAYDLSRSPFFCYRNGFMFFFSTKQHVVSFRTKVRSYEDSVSASLSRRFHVEFDASVVSCFVLYSNIEGRGFLVKDCTTEVEYRSLNEFNFRAVSNAKTSN